MSDYLQMNLYEKKRYRFIAVFFQKTTGVLLDIGCCAGGLRKHLHPQLAYVGIDGMENDFPGFKRVDLNAKTLPFETETFDAINCTAVLEHLFYPLEMLHEMKRVLKADGIVLVSLPNDKSLNALYSQLFSRIPSYEDSLYEHHWKFNITTARDFFKKEFRIIQEAPEFGPLYRKYLPFLKFKCFCTEWMMLGKK